MNNLSLVTGKLSEQDVRDNVKPLFYTRMRLGEFDPADMVPYNKITMAEVQSPAHRELAIQAATMSFVLLKNTNNALPIRAKMSRVAVSFNVNTDRGYKFEYMCDALTMGHGSTIRAVSRFLVSVTPLYIHKLRFAVE